MNQIVHIFKKDARHLWIEIAISLVLIGCMVAIGHVVWMPQGSPFSARRDSILRGIVGLLMPLIGISWLLLVARAIHSEALVGDRQFWITRPYEWKKLMAAKLLFFAAFIYLPFFLMQVILLARAGFSPAHWLPALLLNLVFLSAIILPLAGAATVTRNFGRTAVLLLGVVVCLALIVVSSALTGIGFELSPGTVPTPEASYLIDAVELALGCAVIVLQYRARRTKPAWILLLAIPAAFLVIESIAPDRLLIDHKYPLTTNSSGAPVQFSFVDQSGDRSLVGHEIGGPILGKQISVKIPVHLSGVASDSAVIIDEVKVSLEAANGEHWTSGWQGQQDGVHRQENDLWTGVIFVPSEVFGKYEGSAVNMRLDVALTEVSAGSVTQIEMPNPLNEISVPGFGICVPERLEMPDAMMLSCRFAWQPPFTYLSTRWFSEPCAAAKKSGDPGIEGDGWVGSVDTTKGWTFSPVVAPYIQLSNSTLFDRRSLGLRFLCPGAPATFTHYEVARRVQESLTIPSIHLWTARAEN